MYNIKLPVCLTCLRSGVYCQQCQKKIDEGLVTKLDIEVSKALVKLENSIALLKSVTFLGAFQVGDILLLQISKKSLNRISNQKQKIIDSLEHQLNKKIRILQKTNKPKQLAEELLYPARVIGVNKIWLPDGTSETIIRIQTQDREKLPADSRQLQTTMQDLLGDYVRITFE
ncbi:MAG: hypothetical protein ACTSW4_02040 [Candidatus Ranarchaeia archaeon]